MKIKSSEILERAKALILSGEQSFACAAIQDVETDLRYANNGKDVKNNAAKFFAPYRPENIPDNMKASQPWWPKGASERIDALDNAIADAKKKGD